MGQSDAYLEVEEYVDRNNASGASEDASLPEELRANSRLLDRILGLAPGTLNDDCSAVTLVLSGNGKPVLPVKDGSGIWMFQSLSAVRVLSDGAVDSTYDPTTDTWIVADPVNAPLADEAYDAIALRAWSANGLGSIWPAGDHNIEVDITPGWPDGPPPSIKDIVSYMTRDMRDHQSSGQRRLSEDSMAGFSDQTWRLINSAKRVYSYRGPRVVR